MHLFVLLSLRETIVSILRNVLSKSKSSLKFLYFLRVVKLILTNDYQLTKKELPAKLRAHSTKVVSSSTIIKEMVERSARAAT